MTNNKTILVTGATGQTGGATARHLLAGGWQVRALTRDATKSAAQALQAAGAQIVQGDFSDEAALQAALEGIYGVFSVQVPNNLELEIEHGKRIADLAKAAGIQHLVYSSVGGAERHTEIPHFESKRRIEEYLETLGLPYTILRPAFFMENFYWRKADLLKGQYKSIGLDADKALQMIAVNDIGVFARIAFDNPDQYLNQAIEIAGDELTESEIAATLTQFYEHPVAVVPDDGPPLYPDIAVMNAWFNTHGYIADLTKLRQAHPALNNFKTWLASSTMAA